MDAGTIVALVSLGVNLLLVVLGVVYKFGGSGSNVGANAKNLDRIEKLIGERLDKFEAHMNARLDTLDERVDEVSQLMNKEIQNLRSKIHRILNLHTRLEARVDMIDRELGKPPLSGPHHTQEGDDE